MTTAFLLVYFFVVSVLAQRASTNDVPRDTSFTVFSAADKVVKQYPYARLVLPHHYKKIGIKKNIAYAFLGNRKLYLDVIRPTDRNTHPVVLLIFGGGWRSGDRSQMIPIAQQLALAGYVAVPVDYRLSIEALYPAAIYDLKAAIRWLRAHAAVYRMDSTKIAVLGCSAGGELAAFLGTTNANNKFEGEEGNETHSSSVQAVVDIDGILDFTDPAESGKDTVPGKPSVGAYWFGGPMREKRATWIDASPLAHVDEKTAPIIFINSSLPRFHAGRDSMIEVLDKLGIKSAVRTIPDTPHPFWFFDPWFQPTCRYAVEFLNSVFKGKSQ